MTGRTEHTYTHIHTHIHTHRGNDTEEGAKQSASAAAAVSDSGVGCVARKMQTLAKATLRWPPWRFLQPFFEGQNKLMINTVFFITFGVAIN